MPNDGDARGQPIVPDPDTVGATENEPDNGGDAPHEEQPGSAASPDTDNDSGIPSAEVPIDELQRELADLREQLLRKSADFDNYRKRMQREKEEFAAYANRELLLDLVPIIDDFERAIKSGEESQDFTAFHDGIVMIEKQFISMLERKWHLRRFESVGEEFDPQRHEAMLTEEVPGHERSMVLEDFQKGYLLNERVLRPAKVKVSMPVPGEETDADQGSASNE
ncbi:MAG: nucleotide exchange factor GrpE [Spirochaetota bacterium]